MHTGLTKKARLHMHHDALQLLPLRRGVSPYCTQRTTGSRAARGRGLQQRRLGTVEYRLGNQPRQFSHRKPATIGIPVAGGIVVRLRLHRVRISPARVRDLDGVFHYASAGGRARNPYVAVWLENSAGELVKTVALWHEDRGGQDRWLSEMKVFSGLGAADAQTVSSATRQPGSYTVQWDGSTLDGTRAPIGTYQLFIEAAREHGPYELLQQGVSLGSKAASFVLTPSGELTDASAQFAV